MNTELVQAIAQAIHTGGQGALIILVYVSSRLVTAAGDARRTLHRIEEALSKEYTKNEVARNLIAIRLDTIQSDLQTLPLLIRQNVRNIK